MSEPLDAPQRNLHPDRQDKDSWETPPNTENLADERISEIQAEIDALLRENEDLRLTNAEHRRDEEALRREKDRVGAILSALDTGQSLIDPDMTIVWVNQKARDTFPEQEPIGRKCYTYFEGLNAPCEVCAARRAFATGEVARIEKYVSHRGCWMNIVVQPVKDASGRVTHALESFTDITGRKQTEEELRAALEREHLRATELDATLAAIASGVVIYDIAGVIVRVNEVVRETIDRRSISLDPIHFEKRRDAFGVLRADGTPLSLDAAPYCRALHGETVQGEEMMVTSLNPELLWVDISASPIRDSSGVIVGAIAILTDITRRKRTEEALLASEEMFRALAEHSLDGTLILDPGGEILFANRAAGRLVDIEDPAELIGRRNVMEFIASASRDDVIRDFEHVARGIDAYIACYRILTISQEERWVESIGKSIIFGGAPSILLSLRDITARHRTEESLRESEEKYRALFDNAADAIFIHDLRGRLLDVNRVAAERLGYSREELLTMDLMMIKPPESITSVSERIGKILQSGHLVFESAEITREGRHIPTETSARLITYQGEPAILATTRDITGRRQAEEALKRRTEDLIQAGREIGAARDEANIYIDILTHDVRNANNVSGMYADLLMELAEGDLKVYVKRLHASIDRSSEILENVATIRRASEEPRNLVPVDLDAVIRGGIGRFPGASIRYQGTCICVMANNLLSTVFYNLIGNAVKFGGTNVEITIRVEDRGGDVLISIEDTGPGVPNETKRKLFRRFERGTARGSGQGLGLFIVQALVGRYGGDVRVDDRIPGRPECGAAFGFTLKKAA